MEENVKLIWIDALTSDEYKQGYRQLKSENNTYCCLGVLCDLYIKETGKGYWSLDGFRSEDKYPMNNILPIEVRDWAGLKNQNPSFCNSNITNNNVTLIEINDNGTSFREIAKIIEKEL